MAEILTESFCERCGTRYTFESTAPRKRLGSFRTLSRGLKNFVLSDDTSLDDALAAARSDLEREATAQQLDAFHKTFNFCMSCRQYTCANCWNEVEGRCLTCAPHLGHEVLPAPFPDLAVGEIGNGHVEQPSTNGHAREELEVAWPTSDLEQVAPAEDIAAEPVAAESAPAEAEPVAAEAEPLVAEAAAAETGAEPVAAVADEASAIEIATPDVVPEATRDAVVTPETPVLADAEPVAPSAPSPTRPTPARRRPTSDSVDDRAAAAAAATAELLARFRPGQSIDAALEAFEAEQAGREADASAAVPVDVVAPQDPVPDDVTVGAEPAAASPAAPEPEPTPAPAEAAAEAEPAGAPLDPMPAPTEPPVAATPPDDRVEVPSWRIVAPEQPPRAADGHPAQRPAAPPPPPEVPPSAPEWPAVPQWPARTEEPGGIAAILAARSAAGGSSDGLWAASSQEVASPSPAAASTGVQACVSCGLSLSATARFCRRCGTRQGG